MPGDIAVRGRHELRDELLTTIAEVRQGVATGVLIDGMHVARVPEAQDQLCRNNSSWLPQGTGHVSDRVRAGRF
jgi:hypothetical protein